MRNGRASARTLSVIRGWHPARGDGERPQSARPLPGDVDGLELIDRPGQAPRPVAVVDGAGFVDAIGPSEDVLNRQEHITRAGPVRELDDKIAKLVAPGLIGIDDAALAEKRQ